MRKLKTFSVVALVLSSALGAMAAVAPDASKPGPFTVGHGEYNMGAVLDTVVLPGCVPFSGYDCKIEVRAHVDYPTPLTGVHPLLVFLHGNHSTCGHLVGTIRVDDRTDYTGTGTCPAGYVESPSYLGYEYMANRMASWGYIVVSIDANRGITAGPGLGADFGLILARGRLVLRNLQQLSVWNRLGGTPSGVGVELQNHIDFRSVGLMGHSRGGEGVRAAYSFYTQGGDVVSWPPLIGDAITFEGVFEIAPVDFTGITPKEVAWNVMFGMCDGDVSDLQGVRPFDRTLPAAFESPRTQKSTYNVWGANHNFFNTEWQQSDSSGCTGTGNPPLFSAPPGSPAQRLTSMSALTAFFRGNVGPAADPTFNETFNPTFGIPANVVDENGVTQTYPTRTDRGFSAPATFLVFEDFTGPTGTSTSGVPNEASGITINHGGVPNHDPSLRAGQISWAAAGATTFFQSDVVKPGFPGIDLITTGYKSIEIRLSRQSSTLNPAGSTDFHVQLVEASNIVDKIKSPPVLVSAFTDPGFAGTAGHKSTLTGPVGGPGGLHPILQTVRIPLAAFGNSYLTIARSLRGVRLTFDQTASGAIYVANIRFSKADATGTVVATDDSEPVSVTATPSLPTQTIVNTGTVTVRTAGIQASGVPAVEVQVHSDTPFPVKGNVAVLTIGGQTFVSSRYAGGDLNTLVFSLSTSDYALLNEGDHITVQYGFGSANEIWNCGNLSK